MDFSQEVAKVYNRITDGAFSDMETPAEDILDEFEFCYGRLRQRRFDRTEYVRQSFVEKIQPGI